MQRFKNYATARKWKIRAEAANQHELICGTKRAIRVSPVTYGPCTQRHLADVSVVLLQKLLMDKPNTTLQVELAHPLV